MCWESRSSFKSPLVQLGFVSRKERSPEAPGGGGLRSAQWAFPASHRLPSAHAQIKLPLKWSNLGNFTTQNSNSKQTKASSKDPIIYCCLNESHPTKKKKMFPFNWHLTCSILWKEFFMYAFFLWFWIVFKGYHYSTMDHPKGLDQITRAADTLYNSPHAPWPELAEFKLSSSVHIHGYALHAHIHLQW